MADISRLSRLLNGVARQVDLASNTIVVDNIKIKLGGANSATFTGSLTSDRTITMPDANVDLGQIATNAQAISDHLSDTADAHDASAISFSPTGDIEATDVQAAIAELDSEKQSVSEKGQAGGYASLDGSGKVPVSQLPSAVMTYEGVWNASTNTPALIDGTGDAGMVYRVSVAGTQDLGSGSETYAVGDYVIYNGTIWEKSDTTDAVASVNGYTGVVTLDTDDVSEGASNLYFTEARAQSATISQVITNGVTTKSPSEDAVFDALELKADDADVIKKDGSVDFTADQSMGGFKLTDLADPTSAQDAATKAYVDDAVIGDYLTNLASISSSEGLRAKDSTNTSRFVAGYVNVNTYFGSPFTANDLLVSPDVVGSALLVQTRLSTTNGPTGALEVKSGSILTNPSATGNTGVAYYGSGANQGTGATGDTAIGSGNIQNSSNSSVTGSVDLKSGNTNGLGITGNVNLFSGNITNTSSTSSTGNVLIKSGNNSSTDPAANSGNVTIQTGTADGGSRGDILLTATTISLTATSGIIDANSARITELTDPTSAQDAATKAYVDSEISGANSKVDDLITLSGVAANATDLGSFTGSIIADSQTIKAAIQALETAIEDHINETSGAHDASAISYTPSTLADWDSSTDPGETDDALDQLASRVKTLEVSVSATESVTEELVLGEALAVTGVRAFRFMRAADAGFTAGRVVRADKDATSADNFHVIGLYVAAGTESAADTVTVVKSGRITVTGHGFTVGEPLFLGSSGALIAAGSLANTSGEAQKQVAIARDANTLEVQILQANVY